MSEFRRRLMTQNKKKELPNYLCFTALEEGTFTFAYGSNTLAGRPPSGGGYMSYSLDGNTWTRIECVPSASITTPTIQEGGKVYWKGVNGALGKYNATMLCPFSSTGKYNISGDLRSVINPATMGNEYLGGSSYGYIFHSVFAGNKIVDSSGLVTPTSNRPQSYSYMFDGCTDMIYPPKILDAGTESRPTDGVFRGCTSLLQSPILPKEVLISYQYNMLFDGCSSLKHIVMLATDKSASGSLNTWVRGVPNTVDGVFVKHINATWTTTGSSGVPSNWTIVYYDPSDNKYYTSQDKSQECDDHGNPI